MRELVIAGGWMMVPILLCSVAALAIIAERFWSLRRSRIIPDGLLAKARREMKQFKDDSPMGRILSSGLSNAHFGREIMKERIEEVAGHVVHDLERFLSTLGTIAAISPLMGLLGTVIGMIQVFSALVIHGSGDTTVLAGGISQALITTAAGLIVAIPSLFAHRYFVRHIDELTVEMEIEAIKLMDSLFIEKIVEKAG